MGKCLNCGCEEFVSEPNQYDVMIFRDGEFKIIRSEYMDSEKIFCRECGKEVDVKDEKMAMV